ncbi:hypothetical protein F1189_20810 [Rhodovastum atsumiense]|uniref:Uncharacterized protein n=1 Tax=Rhodovastum atsumiense TaxID=504468 RepID=A0A5M6IPI0_9PROT|nr:hypothetical protein F1189_20810 [Rhodovastum atsumiense]
MAQLAVPVILSALQNNPQIAQQAGGFQGYPGAQAQGLQGHQGLQGLQGLQGQLNPQLNPFAATLQQQNGGADINRLLAGVGQQGLQAQHAQQLAIALSQHITQQLPHIIANLIATLAATQQFRAQQSGLGGQFASQGTGGEFGVWLGGAAQVIGQAAAQQITQQLPQVIGGVLSALQQAQAQQFGAQPFGAQGLNNPWLSVPQSAQSNYAYH